MRQVTDTAWRGQAGLDVTDAANGSRDWSDLSARKGLAVGDAVALTMFAYVGRASHGMASFDLGVLLTALPFLIGEGGREGERLVFGEGGRERGRAVGFR